MSGPRERDVRYDADVVAAAAKLEHRGRHHDARAVRDGAAEFNAGRTGYHGWAMLTRILEEES